MSFISIQLHSHLQNSIAEKKPTVKKYGSKKKPTAKTFGANKAGDNYDSEAFSPNKESGDDGLSDGEDHGSD